MESGCSDDSPECICPCGCGCQNDPQGCCLPFTAGVCASCTAGQHEVPPEEVIGVDRLIALHESVLDQLRKVKEVRHGGQRSG